MGRWWRFKKRSGQRIKRLFKVRGARTIEVSKGCGKVRQEKEGSSFRQPVPNCLISRGEGEEGGGGGNNDDLDEGKGREEEGGGEDKPCVSNI